MQVRIKIGHVLVVVLTVLENALQQGLMQGSLISEHAGGGNDALVSPKRDESCKEEKYG